MKLKLIHQYTLDEHKVSISLMDTFPPPQFVLYDGLLWQSLNRKVGGRYQYKMALVQTAVKD